LDLSLIKRTLRSRQSKEKEDKLLKNQNMNRKNGNYKSKQTSKMAAVFDKNNIKKCVVLQLQISI